MFYLVAVYCCNMYFGLGGGGDADLLTTCKTYMCNKCLVVSGVSNLATYPFLASSQCAQLYSLCATFTRLGLQVNILHKNILAHLNLHVPVMLASASARKGILTLFLTIKLDYNQSVVRCHPYQTRTTIASPAKNIKKTCACVCL